MTKDHDEKEVERKRDAALRRALSTPHKPHEKGEAEANKQPRDRQKSTGD